MTVGEENAYKWNFILSLKKSNANLFCARPNLWQAAAVIPFHFTEILISTRRTVCAFLFS